MPRLALLLLLLSAASAAARSLQAYTCDSINDDCPFKLDGECDSELGTTPTIFCPAGDCADCDPCNAHINDCAGCLDDGCFYCAAEGRCFSQPDFDLGHPSVCAPGDYLGHNLNGTGDSCSVQRQYESVDDGSNREEPIFSDPLYSANAWAYKMINVVPVWESGVFGSGVRVRIHTRGQSVDPNLPDIAGRFDGSSSCEEDTPPGEEANAIAAILAAGRDDGSCAAGIAPGATVSSACGIAGESQAEDVSLHPEPPRTCARYIPPQRRRRLQEECPFQFQNPGDPRPFPCDVCDFTEELTEDCKNSIRGYCTSYFPIAQPICIEHLDLYVHLFSRCNWDVSSPEATDGLSAGVATGRDGKGVVYVVGSGDSAFFGATSNADQLLTNSRLTVSVGAVDPFGVSAAYSVGGSSLFVSAPAGVDYAVPELIAASTNGGCARVKGSTRYASAAVAGVVALVLEANPELTWRDVQGVLASTSSIPGDADRGVLESHSYEYGFGIVDADRAVEAAKSWKPYGEEISLYKESPLLDLIIPEVDSGNTTAVSATPNVGISSTLEITTDDGAGDEFVVESVVVYVLVDHFSRGDVKISLTSPVGTESILMPGGRNENTQTLRNSTDAYLKLLTVRSRGEPAAGSWKLSLADVREGSFETCADRAFAFDFGNPSGPITCEVLSQTASCLQGIPLRVNFDRAFGSDTDALYEALTSYVDPRSGSTMEEACCDCGGGIPEEEGPIGRLVDWRLAIYGRIETEDEAEAPVEAPATPPIDSEESGGSTRITSLLLLSLMNALAWLLL